MHGRLWLNDPDCLLVRESETALSGDEVRSLATVIAMTGGMVLSSDNLPKLSPERQSIISQLLPVYGHAGTRLDLFQAEDVPQVLDLDCGTHRMLALFNWNDAETIVSTQLPPGDWHAFEFWERSYAGVVADNLEVTIPGRSCRLYRLTPVVDRPQVIGSTLHVMQGALEIASETWDGKTLKVALNPVACPDGAIYVWQDGAVTGVPVTSLREPRTIEI